MSGGAGAPFMGMRPAKDACRRREARVFVDAMEEAAA